MSSAYRGVLAIGDPHLASLPPGLRKSDYQETVLGKLGWCLKQARERGLVPILLGDIFHWPRRAPNRLLVETIELLRASAPVLVVVGNHDVAADTLQSEDSLGVLLAAGVIQILDNAPWEGTLGGRPALIGGTSWGGWIPDRVRSPEGGFGAWVTHHDVKVKGYEDYGRFDPWEINGIDVVLNGHIHRSLEPLAVGRTTWCTPGNIVRTAYSESNRSRKPQVLEVVVEADGWSSSYLTIPHRPFREVFHPRAVEDETEIGSEESAFVAGLAQLKARRTTGGSALTEFLERNLDNYDSRVANQIRALAQEVCN